jgi:hypothetical protein
MSKQVTSLYCDNRIALAVPTYPRPNTNIFIKYKLVHLSLGTIIIFGAILE